jgi:hypothetical protein
MLEPVDLPVRCSCGALRGTALRIAPDRVNRVVCHCRFCVGYARHLGAADRVLDEHGGSDVFQMAPADLVLTEGLDKLACMRLTKKGGLRWYASCCDTPIATTLPKPGMPFMAVYPCCLDRSGSDEPIEARLGRVRARVNHQLPREAARRLAGTRGALVLMLVRYLWMLLGWRLRGHHRPFPFFDPETRQPMRVPKLVDGLVDVTGS